MNRGLWYLLLRSFVGAVRYRATKLTQLKYWLGLLGILLYFGMLLLPALTAERQAVQREWGGLGLATMLLLSFALSWLFQGRRSGLGFTEAETELLFPAPLSRHELLNYRLAKAQPGLLFSTLFIVFFTSMSWRYPSLLFTWLMWYLLLNLLHIHGMVASLVSMRWSGKWYAWPLRLGLAALFFSPLVWAYTKVPDGPLSIQALQSWALGLRGGDGPGLWLAPWLYLGELPFVTTPREVLPRLGAVLALWSLCYTLLLRMGVGFEERELAGAKARSDTLKAARQGHLAPLADRPVRPAWFKLSPTGPLWRAIAWKNFTSLTRHIPWMLILLLAVLILQFVIVTIALGSSSALGMQLGGLSFGLAFFLAFAGSQFIKEDLRADLQNIELLKAMPLSSLHLIRGEIYGAVSVLSLGIIGFVSLFSLFTLTSHSDTWSWRPLLLLSISASIILPALALVTYLVDNALALLFPAWVLSHQDDTQQNVGMEQLGRGMINLFLKMIAILAFSLLPGFFAVMTWFLLGRISQTWLFPLGALLFSFVVWLEAEMCMLWMADLYEELDPSAEGLP